MVRTHKAAGIGGMALLCFALQGCGGGAGGAPDGATLARAPGANLPASPGAAPLPPALSPPAGTLPAPSPPPAPPAPSPAPPPAPGPAPAPPPPAVPPVPPAGCATVDGALPLVYNDAGACRELRVRPAHPRIALDPARLAMLRAKAGRNPDGSPGAAPSADPHWNVIYPYLKAQAALASGYDYGVEAWHFALLYAVTREDDLALRAIDWADRFVAARTTDMIGGPGDNRPCIARFPAGLPPTDFGAPGNCLAGGQFLYAHYYLKNVALVYDWLHDRLTPAQRTAYRDYLSAGVHHTWNGRTDGGWAIDDPANNYFLGYLAGTLLQVLATWGEDPAALANWNFLVQHKWSGHFAYLNGAARGGYWHEGTHYGRKSKIDLAEMLLWLRDASPNRELDLFNAAGFSFPAEMLSYQLHAMQPDLFAKRGPGLYRGGGAYNVDANPPTLVQVGDLATTSEGPVTFGDAGLIAMLSDGLAGQPMGRAGQHWLHAFSGGVSRLRRSRVHEFLFEDPAHPAQDYTAGLLPLHAASSHWFHSRSDWTADATSVTFFSATGPQVASHQHRDQNSFVVWHKGWQAADLNSYSGSGLADDTALHNTLLLNGQGQRTPILDPRFSANDPGYGRIEAVHVSAAVPGLRAAVGDATAAYGVPEDFGRQVRLTMDRFDRLLVHLGHIVVVADAVVPSGGASDTLTYMVHNRGTFTATADPRTYVAAAPCGESMASGSGCVNAGMAGGRMVHTTVLPRSAVLRVRTGYSGRSSPAVQGFGLEFDAQGPSQVFLNTMAFGDRAAATLPTVDLLEGIAGFTGTRVVHEGTSLAVLVRDDAQGAPQAGVTFTLPGAGPHALLVWGLAPGRYRVSVGGAAPVDAGVVGADGLLSLAVAAGATIQLTPGP